MIPALSTIVAVYVVFRAISISFDGLARVFPNDLVKAIAFIIVLISAVGTIFVAGVNLFAILGTATEPAF